MVRIFLILLSLSICNILFGEAKTGYVDGDTPSVSVTFDSPVDYSYTLSAAPKGGWVFTDEFYYPSGNGWYRSGGYSISCEQLEGDGTTVFVDAASVFTAGISGRMYIPGSEGGSLIGWNVTGSGGVPVNVFIEPATAILPTTGGEREFTYRSNNLNLNFGALWKYTGMNIEGENINTNWNSGGNIFTFPNLKAGTYQLSAARNSNGALSALANITLVQVKSLSATANGITVTSTTDSPGENQTLYVAKENGNITITATPEPGSSWPTGYPTWKVNGTAAGTAGSATYSLSAITAGEYTVLAICGTSTKSINITVIEVASIKGTFETKSVTSTIDDTANLTNAQTMYLYKGQGKIEFQVVKHPVDSEWPAGYPKWKDGSTEVGTGETYTFNSPSTTGEHIITAHCGDGYYRAIKVIVFELQATDMAFNYNRTSSSSDGMNLRASYSGAEILAPEATVSGGDKKVLYKKDMSVTIKTRFELIPAGATPSLKVKAVAGGSMEGLGEKSITIKNTGISDGDTIATKAGFVAFNSTKNTADKIKKETYSFQWKLTEINGETLSTAIDLNSISNVIVYTISDASISPWTPNGSGSSQPWVSALEFAIHTAGAGGKNASAALAAITSYLHTGHGMTYDADGGGRAHFASGSSASSFNLTGYMSKTGNIVNCYDQAAAVVALGRLLGIGVNYRFMDPFGYINTTNVVGVGNCNNPFYPLLSAPYNIKIVGNDNTFPNRIGFGNHAFANYDGMVYDACAGPATGSQTEAAYVASTIDHSTPAEAAEAGDTSDISTKTIGTIN